MVAMDDRHCLQRIPKPRSAVTAHFVGVTFKREDAAQFSVMAPESEFQNTGEWMRNAVPQRNSFGRHHELLISLNHLPFSLRR